MKRKKIVIAAVSLSMAAILLCLFAYRGMSQKPHAVLPNDETITADTDTQKLLSKADEIISHKMNEGKIPGLSIAIVRDGETIYKSGYGYADLRSRTPVTTATLFQLASNSKAFTAIGVLQLQKDGMIDIRDPITNYIPWLTFMYDDGQTDVKIEDFLHHTSGIPSSTIVQIPEMDEEEGDAIEKTVQAIKGIHLANKPGSQYEYATINYDILGLLIETASGMKYEEYMQKNVLDPAGLSNTYMYRSQAEKNGMAVGYKIGFFAPRQYRAPRYEGNKPAGYIISCADDMAEWLKIQMGTANSSLDDLAAESHLPDLDHEILSDDVYYAAGWYVYGGDTGEIFHGGRNPNFSSYVVFRPEEKTGVAVLCNSKSDFAPVIAESVLAVFDQTDSGKFSLADSGRTMDEICTFFAYLMLCWAVYLLIRLIIRLTRHSSSLPDKGRILRCIVWLLVFAALGYILYMVPYLFLYRQTWRYIFVWYPVSVKAAVCAVYACLALLCINTASKCLWNTSSK